MSKKIIIKLPKGAEDIPVYKEISLNNEDSILIEVTENTFGEDATEEQSEPKGRTGDMSPVLSEHHLIQNLP